MRLWVGAFLLGVLWLQTLASLPSVFLFVLLGTLSLFICYYAQRFSSAVSRVFYWLAACLLGFSYAGLYASWVLSHELPESLEGKTLIAVGTIHSIPEKQGYAQRFQFKVDALWEEGEAGLQKVPGPKYIQLSWYQYQRSLQQHLSVGDKWQLTVRLKRPWGSMNPGGFDYERYLFQQKIRAIGYVDQKGENKWLETPAFAYPVQRVRQTLFNKIDLALEGRELVGMIQALALGLRTNMTDSHWETLRRTGTNHLMAISGLHIGLISGFAFFVFTFLWRGFPTLCLYFPAVKAGAVAAMVAALLYSALAGFSTPTQRAFIMVCVFMGSVISNRPTGVWQSFCLALLLVLLLDPFSTLSVGFWLSFSAVGILLYTFAGRLQPGNKLKQAWKSQWVVWLGLLPLCLIFFQQSALIAPLVNLIAIPWISFIVVPLTFIGTGVLLLHEGLGNLCLRLAELSLSGLWSIIESLSRLPFSHWQQFSPNALSVFLAVCGIGLLLAPRGLPGRFLGIIFLLPLFLLKPAAPKAGEVHFTLLDVGQGLASVVRTQDHVLMFDTGIGFGTSDSGSRVLVPYLQSQGIKQVDTLVLSHNHHDHTGGAISLLNAMPVGEIFIGEPVKGIENAKHCLSEISWQWSGIEFAFLYPDIPEARGNDSSCVLQVRVGAHRLLLTGDIEQYAEEKLLEKSKDLLKSTILVAPHHGSSTSSGAEFLSAVKAEFVLFPVGYRNRYQFPRSEVIERYEDSGATLYNVAETGAISFTLSAKQGLVAPSLYRQEKRRFWHSLITEGST